MRETVVTNSESVPAPPLMVLSAVLEAVTMLEFVPPRVMELLLTSEPNTNESEPAAPVRVFPEKAPPTVT